MDMFIQAIAKLDIATIIVLLGGVYLMNRSLRSEIEAKFEKFEAKLDKRFEAIDRRFDSVDEKITDIDRRLCRLEGAFASKDCCMIKDSSQIKKAE